MKTLKAWVARDVYGRIYLYLTKPMKYNSGWYSAYDDPLCLGYLQFQEVKWSDEEPTKVKIIIDK